VNWIARRAVKVGLAVSVGIGIAAWATSGIGDVLLDAYLLAIGGVLLLALVRATRAKAPAGGPSDFDRALVAMRSRSADTGELALARDLDLSTLSAFHLHIRLRPLLREIAAHRLRVRYGIELDSEPARARELVGPVAWEVVRPDRLPPDDRLAAGPSVSSFRELVNDLERL
jgi:hypothetical protein